MTAVDYRRPADAHVRYDRAMICLGHLRTERVLPTGDAQQLQGAVQAVWWRSPPAGEKARAGLIRLAELLPDLEAPPTGPVKGWEHYVTVAAGLCPDTRHDAVFSARLASLAEDTAKLGRLNDGDRSARRRLEIRNLLMHRDDLLDILLDGAR